MDDSITLSDYILELDPNNINSLCCKGKQN